MSPNMLPIKHILDTNLTMVRADITNIRSMSAAGLVHVRRRHDPCPWETWSMSGTDMPHVRRGHYTEIIILKANVLLRFKPGKQVNAYIWVV